jgi:hypothetical protein
MRHAEMYFSSVAYLDIAQATNGLNGNVKQRLSAKSKGR